MQDTAVHDRSGNEVAAVAFPLSLSRLLVLGAALDGLGFPINLFLADACRRWLVDRVDGATARSLAFH